MIILHLLVGLGATVLLVGLWRRGRRHGRALYRRLFPAPVFLLFQGENFYPDGGASDFVAQADSIERLRVIAEISPLRSEWSTAAYNVWWQIAELRDGKMVVLLNGNLPDSRLDAVSPPFAITWEVPE